MGKSGTIFDNSGSYDNRSSPPATDLSGFLSFPSLSRLFQGPDRAAIDDMRSQLTKTNQSLERCIRLGTRADAEKASKISRSVTLTLTVLKDLEQYMAIPKK